MLSLIHRTFKSVAQDSSLNSRLTSCILLDISTGCLIRHLELFNMSKTVPGFPPQTFRLLISALIQVTFISFLFLSWFPYSRPCRFQCALNNVAQNTLTLLFLFLKGKNPKLLTMILHDCPRVTFWLHLLYFLHILFQSHWHSWFPLNIFLEHSRLRGFVYFVLPCSLYHACFF